MRKKAHAHPTGTIIGGRRDARGAMISVAITLPKREWERLTSAYDDIWRDAEEDLEVRKLTFEERIALFVSAEADRWCHGPAGDAIENDLGDNVPF